MGARAIIEWHQSDSGSPALMQRNPWLSPSTFLPALADFVHTARETGQTPTSELFRSWAADHAHYVLGTDETGEHRTFLAPGSDIQFHYLVQLQTVLRPHGRALLITARQREMTLPGARGTWTITHQATTDEELYEAAAVLLTEQAARVRRLTAQGRGGPMPSPEDLDAHARRLRDRIGQPRTEGTTPAGAAVPHDHP
ncbi:hypothetical protein AB0F20_29735 [Streptomyces goshikiensis]|uniref:hypothetical protein n=1 Tax=Streptomyces goshikiensis TaxID=1942 RepID=UPI0034076276